MSIGDRQVRVFKFTTGKMIRKYDESLSVIGEMQQVNSFLMKHTQDYYSDMKFLISS